MYRNSFIQFLKLNHEKKSINILEKKPICNKHFGEGIDLIKLNNGKYYVFQLTWVSEIIYVYSWPDLEYQTAVKWPTHKFENEQSWGITHDPESGRIFVTNGSSKIHICKLFIMNDVIDFECDNGQIIYKDTEKKEKVSGRNNFPKKLKLHQTFLT